ncbi:cyclophilin-like fold protein [uncultured Methanobrevibacter sp.]|uniref:cyclophilin-like fold protein n=1 Tax=uncultured Methanobrevibacter sp. TaxID=253161 RepID=UPI00262EF033|nr:cyclophilin-like fold protein [uncultured Methanobrevibacter sp.]
MFFLSLSVGSAANPNDVIKLKVNDAVFDVELENNSATQELMKTLKNGNVTINASDYGNFEKVGELGFSLPTNDENVNTAPGDIVLYQGNHISLFYDSHSWSYTKIGKIQNVDSNQLKNVLGSGDVKLTLSLK